VEEFIQRMAGAIKGTLRGFDRVRFRGTLRLLCNSGGMLSWLNQNRVELGDFGVFTQGLTERVTAASLAVMEKAGRPVRYVPRSSQSKEEIAAQIARRDGIQAGPVCALTCVEPCLSYSIRRSKDRKNHVLEYGLRKCLHVYHYWIDPVVGWMNARLQTWAPFQVKVCLNGRRWLAQRMDRARLGYVQRENCFVRLADPGRAQALMDEQLRTDWKGLLNRVARRVNPAYRRIFAAAKVDYYWTSDETEWSTDLLFDSPAELAGVYPKLIRHAMGSMGSTEVMRFLGQKTEARVCGHFKREVMTDLRRRPEGVRIKSRCGRNSVKMYDKQGSVLRIETTLTDPAPFQVYRRPEGQPRAKMGWRKLRKGVADLARRAEVSDQCNRRYLHALASADTSATVGQVMDKLCRPVQKKGRRVRALRPMDPDDARLLEIVARADFVIAGVRNRDLRAALYGPDSKDAKESRRRSAAVSRKLALLRAHGLLTKVRGTHRYHVTDKGRELITTVLTARAATAAKLAA
jgi:hypothetical protein